MFIIFREFFDCTFLDNSNLTYEEIAEKLDMKRTSVYETIKRLIKNISEKL